MKGIASHKSLSSWVLRLALVLGVGVSSMFSVTAKAECNYSSARVNLDQAFWLCVLSCEPSFPTNMGCFLPSERHGYCAARCSGAKDQCRQNNPIDIASGAKVQTEVDYTTDGYFPLTIQRMYNSSPSQVSGKFGFNWKAEAEAKIVTWISGGQRYANVHRPDGATWKYAWNAVDGTTTAIQSGSSATLRGFVYDQTTDIYQLVFKDGSKEHFYFKESELIANGRHESKLWWKENPSRLRHDYSYNATTGVLETITDSFGRSLSFTYTADGKFETITAPGNKTFRYEYSPTLGHLTRVYFPDGTASTTDNPFKEYLYENTRYPHALTGIIDENGDRYATFGYNDNGFAVLTEHAGGANRMEVLDYSGGTASFDMIGGGVTSVSDKVVRLANEAGKVTEYRFGYTDVNNGFNSQLKSVNGEATLNCSASNTSYTYDANGFKDRVKDGRGFVVDYDFNNVGQEFRRTEALTESGGALIPSEETRAIETDWYPSGQVDEIREPGKTTNFTYTRTNGTSGLIATKTETDTTNHVAPYSTNGLTRTWTYSYTYHDAPTNRMVATITLDGPRTDVSDITVQHVNTLGRVYRVEKRVNANTVLTTEISDFTDEGLPETIIDPNGTVTRLTYTPRGWVDTKTVQTSKGNAVTDYDYDNVGQVTKLTLPNGTVLNYKYDDAHRLQEIYTNDNERIVYELDDFGNHRYERIFSSSSALRRLVHKEFNDVGRLWKNFGIEDQELQKNTYDENGNVTHITDNNQQTIIRAFDGLNRLRTITERDTGQAQYEYDGRDNLTSVTDQKILTTSYVVDGFDRRIQETSPDRGVTVYRYDLADNLLKVIDARNIVTDYTYDALNRLKTISYPTSATDNVTLNYDEVTTDGVANEGRGLLTSVTAANGNNAAWVYNDLGGVLRDVRIIGGRTYRTHYDYDLAGSLSTLRYPSGREVEYQKDNKGRVSLVRTRKSSAEAWATLASNIAYEPFGPVSGFTYGNGLTESLTYDLHYQPDVIQTLNGANSIRNLDYGFNLNNELETITDNSNAARSQTFGYDDVGRLTDAQGQYGVLSYGYDFVGNRLSQQRTGAPDGRNFNETYTLPATNHRLASISATGSGGQNRGFAYSDTGNITNDGAYTYVYGANNRLTQVMNGPAVVAEYGYNNFGQRIVKKVGADTTHFVFGKGKQLFAELKGDGTPIRDYVYLGDRVLAMIDVESTTPPTASADLSISKSETIRNGTSGSYTVTIANLGPDAANDVTFSNTLPSGATFTQHVVSSGSCTVAGGNINCQAGTLAAGAAITLQVTASAASNVDLNGKIKGTVSSTTPDPDSKNNSFGGCFIATAAFGSYEHDYLHILRNFRDDYLLTNAPGQTFVENYYQYSPPVAKWMDDKEGVKAITRILLLPLIAAAWLIQAPLAIQLGVLGGLLGLMALWKHWQVGGVVRKALIATGMMLGVVAGSASADQIYYMHTDHLNTPTVVTNQNRTVVWEGVRQPFGEMQETVATVRQPLRMPGQYHDVETGLSYNLHRNYDPRTGRYVQADPIGLDGGMSIYGYAYQNPILHTDPTGKAVPIIIWGGVTLVDFLTGLLGLSLMVGNSWDYGNVTSGSTDAADCNDCPSIEQRLDALANGLEMRYEQMMVDEHGLFYSPHPDYGSWEGHQQRYLREQGDLRFEIAFAESKGCRVSDYARYWSTEPPPAEPF